MIAYIVNLLIIATGVCLVHEAGFFGSLDDWFYSRFKPFHLPYIFLCSLCQVFWLTLLYTIIAGHFTLVGLLLCLTAAHATKILTPLCRLAENIFMKLISAMNSWLKL